MVETVDNETTINHTEGVRCRTSISENTRLIGVWPTRQKERAAVFQPMNLTPQPGDVWQKPGHGYLRVVRVTDTHAITNDKNEIPLDLYPKLAQASINRGATLTRADGSTWSKDIEEFEV